MQSFFETLFGFSFRTTVIDRSIHTDALVKIFAESKNASAIVDTANGGALLLPLAAFSIVRFNSMHFVAHLRWVLSS